MSSQATYFMALPHVQIILSAIVVVCDARYSLISMRDVCKPGGLCGAVSGTPVRFMNIRFEQLCAAQLTFTIEGGLASR